MNVPGIIPLPINSTGIELVRLPLAGSDYSLLPRPPSSLTANKNNNGQQGKTKKKQEKKTCKIENRSVAAKSKTKLGHGA